MSQQNEAQAFMARFNRSEMFVSKATDIHAAYVKQAREAGWTRGPRDNEKKTKPNICSFDELPITVQASNTGPMESIFGYIQELVDAGKLTTRDAVKTFALGLLSADGKTVPDVRLGERTWNVWCGYARKAEPTHPNLVEHYGMLDQGTRNYDLGLNAEAVKFLVQLIEQS